MAAFKFKQFSIEQEHCAMKVNTDAVLLGAWMDILPTDVNLLDVGTGSGVIALMAAQRMAALHSAADSEPAMLLAHRHTESVNITAIDIDHGSYEDAANNFKNSPFNIKLQARLCSLQEFAVEHTGKNENPLSGKKFDLIFSNPPYFINSLKAPNSNRSNSRHTDTLSQAELLKCASELLKPHGRLALILPAAEGELLLKKADFIREHTPKGEQVLYLIRLCRVYTKKNKPAKRWLIEFLLTDTAEVSEVLQSEFIMQNEYGYTSQYYNLVKDFYLNF